MQNEIDIMTAQFGVSGTVAIFLTAYILTVIPLWFIFKKANIEGWKAIIPLYNNYLLFKLAWDTKWFWATIGLTFLLSILSSAAASNVGFFLIFGATATCITAICLILVEIFCIVKLSKSFGHGAGFAVGLIFLEFIFIYILAFDSKKYIGPGGVKVKAVKAKAKTAKSKK